jgi:flagellar biosynthetic protein FlhB
VSAPEASVFKWSRLSPLQGWARLKSRILPAEWAKTAVLSAAVALILWGALSDFWQQVITSPAQSVETSNALIRSLTLRIVLYVGICVGILACGDFFLQRWRFERSLRQTKAEVKEDLKATEGNPVIKGKIRSIQREQAQLRMMARVKDADLIVTDPSQGAVVLEYKPDHMQAPRVIAKGQDFLAQKIRELGRKHDIPTVENASLEALYRHVEIEQEIPMELYQPVADALARIYRNRGSR